MFAFFDVVGNTQNIIITLDIVVVNVEHIEIGLVAVEGGLYEDNVRLGATF